MPQLSAGILLYRRIGGAVEVLLAHPGGPFWRKKDEGAWSIPKGLVDPGEDRLAAARREFAEEMGAPPAATGFTLLGEFRQPGGKVVTAFAGEGDFDIAALRSNTFAMQWPPKSGKTAEFPEVDRAEWFSLEEAARKILVGQRPMLVALLAHLEPPP
jgi:predicted NUDIX family NTP pyrophosphohydrolase